MLCHERYSDSKVREMGEIDYVVIGSGMGGLSCAAVLARMGHRVLVLEQHETDAGGGTHMYPTQKGYMFDSGLHYTVPWSGPIFELTTGGETVKLASMGIADGTFDRVVLGDRPAFGMRYREAHMPELYKRFPHERAGLDKYVALSNRMLGATQWMLLARLLPASWQPFLWRTLLRGFGDLAGRTTEDVVNECVTDPHLRALLTSLWIDTGAVPTECSFYLGACVQRGFPMEGGVYPEGGAAEFARLLTRVIERHGGRVLVRARVERVLLSAEDAPARALGVRVHGEDIFARHGVVSSAGFRNTFGEGGLVARGACAAAGIPAHLPGTPDSPSFVMANIGLSASAETLGLDNCNLWYHPTDAEGDTAAPLRRFMADPLAHDMPVFVTFPSIKDPLTRDGPRTTCQMLVMARFEWFAEFAALSPQERQHSAGYAALKARWEEKCVQTLKRLLPRLGAHIDVVDVSTPLSIRQWLEEPSGGAVGLAPSPRRFSDYDGVVRHLDCVTRIEGLYLTGHDTLLPGVTLAQIMGVVTAFRIAGLRASLKYFLRSLFL